MCLYHLSDLSEGMRYGAKKMCCFLRQACSRGYLSADVFALIDRGCSRLVSSRGQGLITTCLVGTHAAIFEKHIVPCPGETEKKHLPRSCLVLDSRPSLLNHHKHVTVIGHQWVTD